MTRFARHRRHRLLALLLAAAALVLGGPAAVTSGADATPSPDPATPPAVAAESAAASPASPTPVPQPTFDPASVKLRLDLIVDGLETPVYVTDDGTDAACLYVVERGGDRSGSWSRTASCAPSPSWTSARW